MKVLWYVVPSIQLNFDFGKRRERYTNVVIVSPVLLDLHAKI